jgi:hypothetical protein
MIGSMGLASSIGLGIAQAHPARRVVVLDGDGNVLMNLGTLATIARGARRTSALCFDNGVQRRPARSRRSAEVALDAMARPRATVWSRGGRRRRAPRDRAGVARDGAGFLLVSDGARTARPAGRASRSRRSR